MWCTIILMQVFCYNKIPKKAAKHIAQNKTKHFSFLWISPTHCFAETVSEFSPLLSQRIQNTSASDYAHQSGCQPVGTTYSISHLLQDVLSSALPFRSQSAPITAVIKYICFAPGSTSFSSKFFCARTKYSALNFDENFEHSSKMNFLGRCYCCWIWYVLYHVMWSFFLTQRTRLDLSNDSCLFVREGLSQKKRGLAAQ